MAKLLCISEIVERIEPISPEVSNADLYDRFKEQSDLKIVAVVDADGQVLGAIERQAFSLKLAMEYGRALFGQKPVTVLMDCDPMRVDCQTPIYAFTTQVIKDRASDLMRGFIVTRDGKYEGVASVLSVLNAINQDLIQMSADAKRNENFLKMVFEHIPAVVLVRNAQDKKLMLVNNAAEALFGVDEAEVVGKTVRDFLPAEQAQFSEASDIEALGSHEPFLSEEKTFTDLEGRQRIMQFKKAVLRTASGEADCILTLGMDLTEQKHAEAQIAQLAHFDPLTGLANRALFAKDIARALGRVQRMGRRVALLCLDLDRFKVVNDTYGHLTGDRLLCDVADRLRKCVRKSDVISRMGGDEFAIIQDIDSEDDAKLLAKRIVAAFKPAFSVNTIPLTVGVSIGIALAPDDGMDVNNLLSRADLAMYQVKSEGRNGWRFYHAEMDAQLQSRLELEQDLKVAVAEGQFELLFQPLLNLATSEVVSFEALLRWRHPTRGLVSPVEFIPVAEEIGLIGPLGEWVLREACRQAVTWSEPWRVAVNISPLQFRYKSLAMLVAEVLRDTGLPPRRLELEITESVIMENADHNVGVLNEIRQTGVRIAMDDFGTGYSSLSYIRNFPFDKIKIDRSFVRDLPTDASAMSIIRAITHMAQTLGVQITAEGVETEAQMQALRTLNCGEAQGFLIGRPSKDVSGAHSANAEAPKQVA